MSEADPRVRVQPPRHTGWLLVLGGAGALALGASLALRPAREPGIPVQAAAVPDARALLERQVGELIGWAGAGAPAPTPSALAALTLAAQRDDAAVARLREPDVPLALRLRVAEGLPTTAHGTGRMLRLLDGDLPDAAAEIVPLMRARGDGSIRYWRGCDCAFGGVADQETAWLVALGEPGVVWDPQPSDGEVAWTLGVTTGPQAPRAVALRVPLPAGGFLVEGAPGSPPVGVGRATPRR